MEAFQEPLAPNDIKKKKKHILRGFNQRAPLKNKLGWGKHKSHLESFQKNAKKGVKDLKEGKVVTQDGEMWGMLTW